MITKKLTFEQHKRIENVLAAKKPVREIVVSIAGQGGGAFLVGGAVRDLIMDLPIKDLDIEVHNISLEALEQVLKTFGDVSTVGKFFGVLRLHSFDIDWSLPRSDSSGRKPTVTIDPSMDIIKAFKRRDLTMNAMGIDLMTFELIDPFNGIHDIDHKILRTPDPTFFVEDPLRFYRVMQFIGRFEMYPDEHLNQVCRTMPIHTISRERIEVEFEKLFLKSRRPSLGIRWLKDIGRLQEVLPEVAALVGVPQDPTWHPEGDVFEHSMQALDAAAAQQYENAREKLILCYAALCHDLGKSTTTKCIDGQWKSYGHEQESRKLSKLLLKRITHNQDLIATVSTLVGHHMQPVQFVKLGAKPAAYKRLAQALAPYATIELLAQLVYADKKGRNSKSHEPLMHIDDQDIKQFLTNARSMNVAHAVEPPLIQGRDLMGFVEPGPKMGALVKKAYQLQIDENINDKQILLERVLSKKNKA